MEDKKNRPALNEEQRAAAFCTENAVVAAGAGSGKTMVLASRFAWLVTEKKIRVNEILTLTFTKKAAAQMYRRIYAELGEIAAEDKGPKGDLAREALDDFVHARIQTLDSYSAVLVRQAASRYGINPNFVIDEERCRGLAVEEALPFLISKRGHPALERLYHQKGLDAIVHNIFAETIFNYSHMDTQPCFIQDIKKQFDIVCAEWKKQISIILDKLNELTEIITGNELLLPDLVPLVKQFNSGKIFFPSEPDIRSFFDFLAELPPDSCIGPAESHPLQDSIVQILVFLSELYGLNLRKGQKSNNPAKEAIKQFRDSFGEFSSLAVFCMQAGMLLSLMSLLSDLRQRYLERKRAAGIMTFNDVARLARAILMEQQDIRQSEKETFKAIMIDEFQDNNDLQKELLFLLAEKPDISGGNIPKSGDLSPGKLFFVGDEKQSIYLFRNADVSVFRRLKDELGSRDLPLVINYRSVPLLIGAFNAIFGGSKFDTEGKEALAENPSVFAEESPSLPLYEAFYTPLRANAGGKSPGKLTVCVLDRDDETADRLSPVENEARFVAERIRQLLEEKDETGNSRYQPDNIAILFRSRSPQHFFEENLMQLNIPYVSEDISGFFFGGLVNDIASVLMLAAYPLDRAAYAEMLRSPFAGVSLPGLALCLAVFDNAESQEPFSDDPLSLLAEEDRMYYRHGQKIYREIRDKACRESISSLVSELWYGLGYRYEAEWHPRTAVFRELYDYLFHLAVQADADNRGLAAFAALIRSLRASGERIADIEIPLERPSAVHLLTVHKSKGLEFPVVFICCCDKHSQWSGSSDVYDTGNAGITLNPPLPQRCSAIPGLKRNFFWERSLAEEKGKRTAELRRLFYVAMTRAENELYLTGCLGIGNKGKTSAAGGSHDEGADDFSLCMKNFIDEKTRKAAGKNSIPGDAILDDDTFFGLCLPALAAHIPVEGPNTKPSFFCVEHIPIYTSRYIQETENRGYFFQNDQKGLNAFLQTAGPFYQGAEIIRTPEIRSDHVTPTSLREPELPPDYETGTNAAWRFAPERFSVSSEFSGDNADDVFGKVDTMLDNYAAKEGDDREKFNSGGFGTIAHICVEAILNEKEALIPPKLAGFLSSKEADMFLAAGKELAIRFVRSPLGKIAHSAEFRKSEFPFRSMLHDSLGKEVFISGTVDLLFEDEQAIHVVDFKTDSKEDPREHTAQMACYYRAVSGLFAEPAGKRCRIWLYYLRSGHAVEMTEKVKHLSLERIISA
jgi:ATP-dependent helicase/nuclease subunit A